MPGLQPDGVHGCHCCGSQDTDRQVEIIGCMVKCFFFIKTQFQMEAGSPQPFNGADVDWTKLGRTRQAREYFIGIIFRNIHYSTSLIWFTGLRSAKISSIG